MRLKFPGSPFNAVITNQRELIRYVVTVSAVCVAIALAVDVANQLSFFVDWGTCFRSWTITTGLALVLALPISRAIGTAHLELYRAKSHAEELSRTDPLTGLPNRRALIEKVDIAGAETLALVIVDIDRFKGVNDTHGHLAGDQVIRSIGQSMAAELGPLGMVARIGGEEFALLSSGVPPETVASSLMRFRDKVSSTPVAIEGTALQLTISAGIATRGRGETFDYLFSQADQALYSAKKSGRNRLGFAPALGALAVLYEPEPEDLEQGRIRRSG